MRTIAHISDLHFGRVDTEVIAALAAKITASNPDLIAVSGDLTQRARVAEFKAARAFLDSFPQPKLIVPGNHDVPLENLIERFLRPLAKYKKYITDDLEPFYKDDEIAVLGINTARSLVHKGGRVNQKQVEASCARLDSIKEDVARIIVTHHPFDLPADSPSQLVGRARMAMNGFSGCQVDLFLSGHLHVAQSLETRTRYAIPGYGAVVVQAGTATSTRTRGEPNSWNLIRIQKGSISVERFNCASVAEGFSCPLVERFDKTNEGWVKVG